MSKWKEAVHLSKRGEMTSLQVDLKQATFEAWLENRAYSTYPVLPWSVRVLELRWQTLIMRQQFSARHIRIALYER